MTSCAIDENLIILADIPFGKAINPKPPSVMTVLLYGQLSESTQVCTTLTPINRPLTYLL